MKNVNNVYFVSCQIPVITLDSEEQSKGPLEQKPEPKRRRGRPCKIHTAKRKTKIAAENASVKATDSVHNLSAAQALLSLSNSDPSIAGQDSATVQTGSTSAAGVIIASGASPQRDTNFQSSTSTPLNTPEKRAPLQSTGFMETSSILATETPTKSRKRCLKSKPPVKNKSLSMPIFLFDENSSETRKKIEAFTQSSTDDVMSHVIAQPLATLFTETGNVDLTVSHFLSNSELFASFNQVLEDYTAHEKSTSLNSSDVPDKSKGKLLG